MFGHKKNSPQGLKIIIVGCGKVGATLVERLSQEGHDITIIDKKEEKIHELGNLYDVMGLVGNGASYSVLKEAGVEQADLIIAVADSDELNLLCCTVAKRVGNCAAIARVRTPDYSQEIDYLRAKLELAKIINPESSFAREVARILALPNALEVNSFHGRAELVKFKIPKGNMLHGMTVADLGSMLKIPCIICAIEKDGEVYIPSGKYMLHEEDIVSIVASRNDIKTFFESIGFKSKRVKDAMIIGGGKAAYYLAKRLMHSGISVKIIEQDRSRCEELSILLPKAIIINGDGTDQELLKEEGIDTTESFIALTGIDEENILLTLHANQVSNAKVVTKINRVTFKEIISNLDLGSVLYPRYITTEAIIAYVRAKNNSRNSNIETLYHMYDERVEAIEFCVEQESPVTNTPLKDLNLKKNLLVACISRSGRLIIPSGQDSIKVGDRVIIVTTNSGFLDLQDILEG